MREKMLHVRSPLVWGALATLALQVLSLAFLGTTPPGPAFSQTLQSLSAFFAGIACLHAGRRSAEFARSFWLFSSGAFLLWSLAQAFGTYDLYFVSAPSQSVAPSVILYFFSLTPMFAALFLSPGAGDQEGRWESYLDFLQILIVTGTIYVLFLYAPWWRLSEQEWVARRATTANLRNIMLSAGFAWRVFTSRSKRQRELYLRVGVPIALYSLGFWVGKRGISNWSAHLGSWFDLGWTLPFLLMVLLALGWQGKPTEREPGKPFGFVPLVLAFLLTLSLPAVASGLLVFRGHMSTPEVLLISAAAALVVTCSFTRLVLAQYRQKQTFQRLKNSELRYRSLFERNLAGVFCTAPDGTYLDCNEAYAHILGYASREEVLCSSAFELYVNPTERTDRLARIRREKTFTNVEVRLRRKDGSFVWALQNVTLMVDAQRNEFIEGTIVDITERKRLEEQLRQSQKMEAVGQLAGGVAHDFNNLLTVIKGYSRMVLDQPRPEENVRANVEQIEAAAERAVSVTRHLLAFSRKQVLQPRVIDLNVLTVNLDQMLRRLIGDDIVVETVTAPDLGSVNADPGQIEQVIMNLVVNARDAMPKGGKLTLETANVDLDADYARDHDGVHPGRYVMLAVSDTGVGMDPEIQLRIFEPFFTTKETGRGTGLGLSTAYGIVKQSGGHIWVYSEPGQGTTFKIYFVRVDRPAEVIPQMAAPATPIRGTETIFLVEDDQQVRELTQSVLVSIGYSVLVAANGPEVKTTCEQYPNAVHLLLTDVVMPGISGREVAKQVSARWPNAKVLYMSGYTANSIVHHGVLDEGTFFLPKPFTPSALTNKLREVLDGGTRTH